MADTKAISSLKNNKSSGCDNIRSEHLKYAPIEIHTEIAELLNSTAENGEYPKEIKIGHLTPLPKPGKPKGPVENLRPNVLLSILRKILAICVIRRIDERVRKFIIPNTQAAYTKGRSTTELIFAFKLLAEKAVTSSNYEINLLMLDMSKAFDTIQRGVLFDDLKEILENDELHLVHLLLDNVQIAVKLENKIGDQFESKIGSPQGDAASALFFVIYLATTLKIANKKLVENNLLSPEHLRDHSYVSNDELSFTLDQQYADDISWASTSTNILENIEKTVPSVLQERNLFVNSSKTEKYTVTNDASKSEWKDCKLVGSKLDTERDIKHRKQLASATFNKLKPIFTEKHCSSEAKLDIFNAIVESIFLYNSEIWTLTKKLENEIDAYQRKLLRYLMNYRYTDDRKYWPSNEELYINTKQTAWSVKVKKRRLSFFGHVCRLPENTPAQIALKEAQRKTKRPKGRPKTTFLQQLQKDLSEKDIYNISSATELAQDRVLWRSRFQD